MWKRFLVGGGIVVCLTTIAVAATVLLQVGALVDLLPKNHNLSVPVDAADAGAPQTLLVLGSDHRAADKVTGDKPRSDTIMLMRLDPNHSATTLLSIPRDLKVAIPGHGTDKINQAYYFGGPALTLRTVKRLLSSTGQKFPINHVINIDFRGFRRAVDYLGCVYGDIDRRYFNPVGTGYASIDIQPGYQRLCGQDALDYVRFRHADTDLVRSARQQDFLRQVKAQVGAKQLFDKRDKLVKVFGAYTETDKSLKQFDTVLGLLKLAAFSAGHPVREIKFPAIIPNDPRNTFLGYRQGGLDQAVRAFMSGNTVKKTGGARRVRSKGPSGLTSAATLGQDQAIVASRGTPFPVLYPTTMVAGAQYVDPPRAYRLRDLKGGKHRAYRMVVALGPPGEYYGIQGMNWTNPPILASPDATRTMGGKRLQLYFDGSHLRLVAFRRGPAVYWVSNTLTRTVTNKQMLGIAASLRPVGG